MRKLAVAVSAGFRPERTLREDDDLKSLFTRADFLALEANVDQPGILETLCDAIATGLNAREIEHLTIVRSKPLASSSKTANSSSRSSYTAKAVLMDVSTPGRTGSSRVEVVVRPGNAKPRLSRQPRANARVRN